MVTRWLRPPVRLISLAEASRKTGKMLTRGAFSERDTGAAPTLSDLTEALHFALGDGRIWLNDQRMVLMQSLVLGRLRQEIIDAFGLETAKGIFMRVGYMQGVRDAELIQKRFPPETLTHALAAGPRVHTLEGFVKVTTKQFRFDLQKGTYFGEFYWDDSSEAAEHLASYGIAAEPVCWMQTGYPSGYTSTLFGRPVIFREIECAGMGAARCLVVGQHADGWEKDAPERHYLGLDWKARPKRAAPRSLPATAASRTAGTTRPRRTTIRSSASRRVLRTRLMLEKVADTNATVLFIANPASARSCSRASCIGSARGRADPSCRSTAPRSPKPSSNPSCSASSAGVHRRGPVARRLFRARERRHAFLGRDRVLTYRAQGKVLRAIQERKIERVGGTKTVPIDVRVVAASNVDLSEEVRAGRFRQDLYFRLCVFPIVIPPLRDRRDDIPLLASTS